MSNGQPNKINEWIVGGAMFAILILGVMLFQNGGALWQDDGTRMSCVDERQIGPLYAAIDYSNSCSERIRVTTCSKTFAGGLWNAIVNGRADGGDWSCRTRLVAAGSHIDNRILAGEQSSAARVAMSEVDYRLFACASSYEVRVSNMEEGTFSCAPR